MSVSQKDSPSLARRAAAIAAAGFVCGLLVVVLAIGNATLLARGDLASSIAIIVGIVLFAAAVLSAATTFISGIPGQVSSPQEISVVALGTVIGAASAAFSSVREGPAFLATILVTIALTTGLGGLAMFLLGKGGLGRVIRFVPFPVFGGFLAITGWYLLIGGLETALGHHLDFRQLSVLAEPVAAAKVGLAVAFVVLIRLLYARAASNMLLPLSILIVIVLFNIVVLSLGPPQAELQQLGWILAVPTQAVVWPPVGLADLAAVDWRAVGAGLLFAPFVVVVTAAAAMMNVSGIELELKGDVDLNRELRSIGIGNMLASLVGGVPGFPSISNTLLAVRLGAPERAVGLVTGAVSLAAMLFAPQLLGLAPAPLFGALLMWVGVSRLIDWVILPIRTLRRSEHAIILIILAVGVAAGFAAGIMTGLLAALLLFVFEYSRVEGVRFVATARDYQTRMLSDEYRALMEHHGASIVIMKLSGFVFFGTSDRIIQRIANSVAAGTGVPVRFIILDFRRVSGIDSSAIMSFNRLRRLARSHDFVVVFAGLNEETSARLLKGGLDVGTRPFQVEPDLEAAVEWAERHLLDAHGPSLPSPAAADRSLASFLGDETLAKAMRPYFTEVEFAPDSYLIEQGTRADDIYFIEAGEGVVVLEAAHGPPVKLMAFGNGTILGEMAFYRGERRSASAIARSPIKAWMLSRAALDEIEREVPALAATFHYQIARALSSRLQSANRLIRLLAD
ncbi:SulP family inorganic anion transporter [Taklimakanibacter deserti]|uniref:SulP family inorganic anion transporter n=1 Tax=Taklimakanibacter deserti TaxID=2267839 RepID=UPI0013C4A7E8